MPFFSFLDFLERVGLGFSSRFLFPSTPQGGWSTPELFRKASIWWRVVFHCSKSKVGTSTETEAVAIAVGELGELNELDELDALGEMGAVGASCLSLDEMGQVGGLTFFLHHFLR